MQIYAEPGGEKYVGYVKQRLRLWHQQMLQWKVDLINRRIDMGDGFTICLKSLHLGNGQFADHARITGGAGDFWLGVGDTMYLLSWSAVIKRTAVDTGLITSGGWAISGEYLFNNNVVSGLNSLIEVYDSDFNLVSSTDYGVPVEGSSIAGMSDSGRAIFGGDFTSTGGGMDAKEVDHLGAVVTTYPGAAPTQGLSPPYIYQSGSIYYFSLDTVYRMVLATAIETSVGGLQAIGGAFSANSTRVYAALASPDEDKIQIFDLDLAPLSTLTIPGAGVGTQQFKMVADDAHLYVVYQRVDEDYSIGVFDLITEDFTSLTIPFADVSKVDGQMYLAGAFT